MLLNKFKVSVEALSSMTSADADKIIASLEGAAEAAKAEHPEMAEKIQLTVTSINSTPGSSDDKIKGYLEKK
jgi:hypothetical protein